MISFHRRDRLEEFTYDPATGRYRWKGAAGGQFASKKTVFTRLRSYIEEQKESLRGVGQRWVDKDIDLGQFQQQAADRLKNIHISQSVLGHDGLENMKGDDWLRVGRELKRHYYAGIGDNGKRYGLSHLAQEMKEGKVSDSQLLSRLDMYGNSGKVSKSQGFIAHNMGAFAIRVLGNTDNHCSFCLEQAAKPAQPIEDVSPIGCCPNCLARCRCSIKIVGSPTLRNGNNDNH